MVVLFEQIGSIILTTYLQVNLRMIYIIFITPLI